MALARWLRPICVGMLCCFGLVACAETQFLAHASKRMQQASKPKSAGGYKIGGPYQVRGAWYYPGEDYEYSETGIASWYGHDFHGLTTANGERYDMARLTAAHRTLPMPSAVRVTNLENGRSVVLRVNDRGPFARGRIIDVSRRGADLLGFRQQGTAKVRVEILANESRDLKVAALNTPTGRAQQVAVAASPRAEVTSTPLPDVASTDDATTAAPTSAIGRRQPPPEPVLPTNVTVVPVTTSDIYVQAGAFGNFENALRMRDRIFGLGETSITRVRAGGLELYRVRVGPINDVNIADAVMERMVATGITDAQLVVE